MVVRGHSTEVDFRSEKEEIIEHNMKSDVIATLQGKPDLGRGAGDAVHDSLPIN